jgi:uncharacterized protein
MSWFNRGIVSQHSSVNNGTMVHISVVAVMIGCVALLYATAGQAGGTAFIAVLAFAGFSAFELRPTALLLNIFSAGYATWRLYRRAAVNTKLLLPLILPSLIAALVGGFLALPGRASFILTGLLLVAAALLMTFKQKANTRDAPPLRKAPAAVIGSITGFVSGLTGVGGGVFLAPTLITFGWASARDAAAISPPFILCNSALGLLGALLAGQKIAAGAFFYAVAAIVGAIGGTAIGLRWMSERTTRYVLTLILLFAALRMFLR